MMIALLVLCRIPEVSRCITWGAVLSGARPGVRHYEGSGICRYENTQCHGGTERVAFRCRYPAWTSRRIWTPDIYAVNHTGSLWMLIFIKGMSWIFSAAVTLAPPG